MANSYLEEQKPVLLTMKEFCEYIGICEKSARNILKKPDCRFVIRIGRRVFIHKELLDKELLKVAKFGLVL